MAVLTASITNALALVFFLLAANYLLGVARQTFSKIPTVNKGGIGLLRLSKTRPYLQAAYNKYSKSSRLYHNAARHYVLPVSLIPEFRRLPGTALNSSVANEEVLSLARSLGKDYWDVVPAVRHNVIRSITRFVDPVRDEVSVQSERHFSSFYSDGFVEVPIWMTANKIIAAIATRFLAGKELTRNDVFQQKIVEFARAVGVESTFLDLVPGWLVGLFSKQKARVGLLKGLLRPLILDCLEETGDGKVVLKEWDGEEKPLLPDFVAYVLPKYSQEGKTVAQIKEMIVEQTAGRILGIWFAAIDTTSMTFSQVTMDLLGQSQAEYANVLREEIRTVLKKHEGQWSFEAVSELKHLDSFIHETLRLHPVGSHLAQRKVLLPGGITFSNGEHLPQGSLIELPIWFIHTDEQFYDSAAEFRGFRFVGEKHPEAAPSDTFMAFGHGNHACPGRRLALMVVKFMVIEMLMNYEYVPFVDGRPKDMLFGAAILPSLEQKIRIRKRVV